MKFDLAYQYHLRGEKVRRELWTNKEYFLGKNKCPECDCEIDYEDAIADDWEIMK